MPTHIRASTSRNARITVLRISLPRNSLSRPFERAQLLSKSPDEAHSFALYLSASSNCFQASSLDPGRDQHFAYTPDGPGFAAIAKIEISENDRDFEALCYGRRRRFFG